MEATYFFVNIFIVQDCFILYLCDKQQIFFADQSHWSIVFLLTNHNQSYWSVFVCQPIILINFCLWANHIEDLSLFVWKVHRARLSTPPDQGICNEMLPWDLNVLNLHVEINSEKPRNFRKCRHGYEPTAKLTSWLAHSDRTCWKLCSYPPKWCFFAGVLRWICCKYFVQFYNLLQFA